MQINKTDASLDYYGSFAPSQITATALQSKGNWYCAELSLCLRKKKKKKTKEEEEEEEEEEEDEEEEEEDKEE